MSRGSGLAAHWLSVLPVARRVVLAAGPVTIDLDSTDVEVYGRGKAGVAYNYQGQRAGRPHLATWAEAEQPLAADLLAGNDDVRPRCADLLGRALAGLPADIGHRSDVRPRVRADAGYFTADLAHAAAAADCEYAVAAKRKSAFWRELAAVADDAWIPAKNMPAGQVAAIGHAPTGWPWSSAGTSTTPGRSRSSSPTSPPAPQPTSSRSRRGSVAAPTSRSGSAKPNSAPA